MNQEWKHFLAQHGASNNDLDFGNPAGELNDARTGTIITPLTDLGLIRASGADAVDFLHNLLTNDVEALTADGAGRYGFCTPKGRLLASFLMWREAEDLMLTIASDLHASILKKLSMYVLRSKVKLSDASDSHVVLGLAGPQAETALASLGTPPSATMHTTAIENGRIVCIGEQRWLLMLAAEHAPAAWQKLTVHSRPTGLNAWRWLDICAGIPHITAATQEEFIPQMVNYELVGGVSFKKGCYPGQEIVARTQYLGKIKRRMYRAHLESGTPVASSPIFAPETGDQACGMVLNAAEAPGGGHDVLAVIQTSCAETGRLYLGDRSGPLLVLHPLPYQVS